jgi:hypothetical protein
MDINELKKMADEIADLYIQEKVATPIEGAFQVLKDRTDLTDQHLQRLSELSNKGIWRRLYMDKTADNDKSYGFPLIDSKIVISTLKNKPVSEKKQTEISKEVAMSPKTASMEDAMVKISSATPCVRYSKREELSLGIAKDFFDNLPQPTEIKTASALVEKDFEEGMNRLAINEIISKRDMIEYQLTNMLRTARTKIAQAIATNELSHDEVKSIFKDTSWYEDVLDRYKDTVKVGMSGKKLNKEHPFIKMAAEIDETSKKLDILSKKVEKLVPERKDSKLRILG